MLAVRLACSFSGQGEKAADGYLARMIFMRIEVPEAKCPHIEKAICMDRCTNRSADSIVDMRNGESVYQLKEDVKPMF